MPDYGDLGERFRRKREEIEARGLGQWRHRSADEIPLGRGAILGLMAVYLVSIVAANWLIRHVGTVVIPGGTHLVPVGFGLLAPSGTFVAALTLVVRDVLQRAGGRRLSMLVILPGAGLSALIDVHLALASGAAFLLGELMDLAVYTPLARRRLVAAVFASVLAGAVVDSVVFLWLAGIPFSAALLGLLVGKAYVAVAAVPAVAGSRRWLPAADPA